MARNALKKAGVEAYSLEARLITAHACGKTKEAFLRDLALYSSNECEQRVKDLIERRLNGEPMAYITGEWEFFGLPLEVTPDVLIPRSDTEVLVETALRALIGRKMDARILDLCSGSGCIGCALAHELPAARVVQVDISDAALEIGRRNARRNRLNRVIGLRADALKKPPMSIGSFDLIVSNPPYVPSIEILTLDGSVRDDRPLVAAAAASGRMAHVRGRRGSVRRRARADARGGDGKSLRRRGYAGHQACRRRARPVRGINEPPLASPRGGAGKPDYVHNSF